MVLEALAVVGFAGNVVQFVDFSCKLFSETRKIRSSSSGLSSGFDHLSSITASLKGFCTIFSDASAGREVDRSNVVLRKLAADCGNAAQELLDAVEKVRSKNPASKFSTFRAVLKEVWKQHEINHMAKRLDSFRGELIVQLEVLASSDRSAIIKTLDGFQLSCAESNINMNSLIKRLKQDIQNDLLEIRQELMNHETQLVSQLESLVSSISETERSIQSTSMCVTILRLIHFEGMETRQESIREAHPTSCDRAFTEKLGPWFSSNDPLFWVSGKPGSGKSTLMKFLASYEETTSELTKWAGDRALVTASHYLWVGGNMIQKSQEGLLRSILFRVLQQEPELVRVALPDHWNLIDPMAPKPKQTRPLVHVWTFAELENAFRRLTTVGSSNVCYCLFIDGLDEYHGDKDELIGIIKSLASMPNMKLCIASRPWNVFESAFGGDLNHKIYLQDLNVEGIRHYVADNLLSSLSALEEDQAFDAEEVQASEITEEIVRDAQGVFLWVFLVVRSLREGIRNYDRLVDLRNRLREFPKDLNAFFRHMFDSMEPVYRKSAARTFKIAMAADQPLLALDYWWADVEETKPDFLLVLLNNPIAEAVERKRELVMKKRVNGRLQGLLEASYNQPTRFDFLHRTVKDFLMTEEMNQLLNSWLPPDFEPVAVILKTMLAALKSKADWRKSDSEIRSTLPTIYAMAKRYEDVSGNSAYKLLLILDSIIQHLINIKTEVAGGLLKRDDIYMGIGPASAWTHAICWRLQFTVTEWLTENARRLSDVCKGHLLHNAIAFCVDPNNKHIRSDLTMMECILKLAPAALNAKQLASVPTTDEDSVAALELLATYGTPISCFSLAQRSALAERWHIDQLTDLEVSWDRMVAQNQRNENLIEQWKREIKQREAQRLAEREAGTIKVGGDFFPWYEPEPIVKRSRPW